MDHYTITEGPVPVVTLIDERLSTTTICLASAYGARHDPVGRCGSAHLLEHLLMSAPSGDVPSLSEHVERLGGHANAETGPDRMLFYAQVHPDDAEDIAGLLYRAVLEPRWEEPTLVREKRAVFQELAAAAADPADLVQDAALAALFPGHPLGQPVGGTTADVEALDLASLAAGHAERLLTAPLTAVVVGPRAPAAIDPAIAAVAADTLARVGTAADLPAPLAEPVAVTEPNWPGEFSWFCAAARSVPQHDVRRPHFDVLAHLLGSSSSSLLYRRLRGEAGLAYAFQAWHRGYADTGAWRLLAGVEPQNGNAAVDVVRATLEELADRGPKPDDLAPALRQARMSVLTTLDNPLECARYLAVHSGGATGWSPSREIESIDGIDADDIRRAAEQTLAGLRVVVRPEAEAR
ncbi:pitrilysin family protein [Streptomyces sp. Ru62]|uniref:M16 family metallopeptidase n=1 Tax=Streptomyces sp. Ru62 TaxID=2080745 RepID=UPI0015E4881A|nr:insulinase family protein [Streptomyces sp. Ru62]